MVKAAGTTLHYVLRQNFGINYIEFYKIPSVSDQASYLRCLKLLCPNLKGIGGHPPRANSEFKTIFPDIQYFTFLRDPIQRFYSFYNGQLKNGVHKDSIEQRCRLVQHQDYQTKFLLGCRSWEEMEFVADKNDLEKAKRILQRDYSFVGIVERFDESLLLMKTLLNQQDFDPRYEKRNVKNSAKKRRTLSKKDLTHIVKANQFDMELYAFAQEVIWPDQVEQYGEYLDDDLASFQKNNNGFQFDRMQLLRYRLVKYGLHRPLSKIVQYKLMRT
ncbi:MAG: sulfotransferase family 2 domain-containing protein [Desulfobulbaceae bacterium]|nr:sulfotransferase family 2 domain-containing protein [Desulfobulbaceae bacterium]